MNLRLCLFSLLLLLPLFANAGTAADFAAASRTQQVALLQQWAATPDVSRLPLLQALKAESVVIDQNKQPFSRMGDKLLPLDASLQPTGNVKKVFMNNRLRVLVLARSPLTNWLAIMPAYACALPGNCKTTALPISYR